MKKGILPRFFQEIAQTVIARNNLDHDEHEERCRHGKSDSGKDRWHGRREDYRPHDLPLTGTHGSGGFDICIIHVLDPFNGRDNGKEIGAERNE